VLDGPLDSKIDSTVGSTIEQAGSTGLMGLQDWRGRQVGGGRRARTGCTTSAFFRSARETK